MEWRQLVRRLAHWTRRVVEGGRRRATVEISEEIRHHRSEPVVEIPLGRCPGVDGEEVRLSDRLLPSDIRDVVRFAGRRLPALVWRIHGLRRRPWSCDRAARWVAALAGDAGEGASIVIVAGDMPTSWRRRFVARLARHTEATRRSRGSSSRANLA